MIVPHRRHIYGPPPPLTLRALLFYMQMMFVPCRKHAYGSTRPVRGISFTSDTTVHNRFIREFCESLDQLMHLYISSFYYQIPGTASFSGLHITDVGTTVWFAVHFKAKLGGFSCHHSMARPRVADGRRPPAIEGSCVYI
jgi:hypothetical protein